MPGDEARISLMGDAAPLFWPLIVCGAAFAVAALVQRARGRLFWAWTFGFGAVNSIAQAALEARWFPLLVGAITLGVPLLLIPAAESPRHRAVRIWGLVLLACSLGGLWWVLDAVSRPALAGRPVVGDRWSSYDSMHVTTMNLALLPDLRSHRARLLDWGAPVRIEWPAMGGGGRLDVVLENAGPAEDYEVMEGDVELWGGDRSRLGMRCRFGPDGGICRVGLAAVKSTGCRVLVLGGLAGDWDALDTLLGPFSGDPPDVIALLGDMIEPGDYLDLLYVRDRVDQLGSRVLYVPGANEAAEDWKSGWPVFFQGGAQVHRLSASNHLNAILLDANVKVFERAALSGVMFGALMGRRPAPTAAFINRAPWTPPGREADALPDASSSDLLAEQFRTFGVSLVASHSTGPAWRAERDGVLHLATGGTADEVQGWLVTYSEGRVEDVVLRTAARGKRRGPWWVRWDTARAVCEEHQDIGLRLALSLVGGATGLLLVFTPRQRRGNPTEGGDQT